jgi:hypothetical protein
MYHRRERDAIAHAEKPTDGGSPGHTLQYKVYGDANPVKPRMVATRSVARPKTAPGFMQDG